MNIAIDSAEADAQRVQKDVRLDQKRLHLSSGQVQMIHSRSMMLDFVAETG